MASAGSGPRLGNDLSKVPGPGTGAALRERLPQSRTISKASSTAGQILARPISRILSGGRRRLAAILGILGIVVLGLVLISIPKAVRKGCSLVDVSFYSGKVDRSLPFENLSASQETRSSTMAFRMKS